MKKIILFVLVVITMSICYAGEVKTDTKSKKYSKYQCDGRQYCSQMHSCEEAIFFLRNCKDPKMDGNKDGIPCEKQWCGYSH